MYCANMKLWYLTGQPLNGIRLCDGDFFKPIWVCDLNHASILKANPQLDTLLNFVDSFMSDWTTSFDNFVVNLNKLSHKRSSWFEIPWRWRGVAVIRNGVETRYEDFTHEGRVTHICVSKLTIIVLDNGLSRGRRQAIIGSNVWILLIGPIGTYCNEISIKIYIFSFTKIHLQMSSGYWRPLCIGLNVLTAKSGYLCKI